MLAGLIGWMASEICAQMRRPGMPCCGKYFARHPRLADYPIMRFDFGPAPGNEIEMWPIFPAGGLGAVQLLLLWGVAS